MNSEILNLIHSGRSNEACDLIRKAIAIGNDFQGYHVTFAHALLTNGDWRAIDSLLPPDTNSFLTSGWLYSVQMGKPVNAAGEPIPWLTYPAIDFLDSVVQKEWLTFEWGSGNSTLWWANKISHVYSTESDVSWFNDVKSRLPSNATIFHETTEDAYANAISSFNDRFFDAIVIDGSFRNRCAELCVPKLKDSGIVVFDNSDGIEHDAGVEFLSKQGFFRIDYWGLTPSYLYKNCTSIFVRNFDILRKNDLPSQHNSSVGISCFQAMNRL